MATIRAVAATSNAILNLLKQEFSVARQDYPQELGNLDVSFSLFQTKDLKKDRSDETSPPIVSLYLYQVSLSTTTRNQQSKLGEDGRRYRPSLPLDLHYLLTAWGNDPLQQQILLTWSMRVLEDIPIIPLALLNSSNFSETFNQNETVEITAEPLTMSDLVNVWEVSKDKMEPSMAYIARLITVDSRRPLIEGEPVQTRSLGFGKKVNNHSGS